MRLQRQSLCVFDDLWIGHFAGPLSLSKISFLPKLHILSQFLYFSSSPATVLRSSRALLAVEAGETQLRPSEKPPKPSGKERRLQHSFLRLLINEVLKDRDQANVDKDNSRRCGVAKIGVSFIVEPSSLCRLVCNFGPGLLSHTVLW